MSVEIQDLLRTLQRLHYKYPDNPDIFCVISYVYLILKYNMTATPKQMAAIESLRNQVLGSDSDSEPESDNSSSESK